MGIEFGTIDLLIDDLTSCLKDSKTGELKKLLFLRLRLKSF